MAKLKKPKLKKLPKKPKGKKTLAKAKSYADRAEAVIKENEKKVSVYVANKKKIEGEKKQISSKIEGIDKKAARMRSRLL